MSSPLAHLQTQPLTDTYGKAMKYEASAMFPPRDPPGFQQTERQRLLESGDGSHMLRSITPAAPATMKQSLAQIHACLLTPVASHGNWSHNFVLQSLSFCFKLPFDNSLKSSSNSYITITTFHGPHYSRLHILCTSSSVFSCSKLTP